MIIPEGPTLDSHVLKPIVQRIFKDLNRKATIEVLQDPHLGGVSQALDKEIVQGILRQERMIDLFLLIVDRDCETTRKTTMEARLAEAAQEERPMIGCLAIEEVETWILALHRKELEDGWNEVRAECHPKERYFDKLVKEKKWGEGLGRGRVAAMKALPGNWKGLRERCPELKELQNEIADWFRAGGDP